MSKTVEEQLECEASCARFFVDFEGLTEEGAAWLKADGVLNSSREPCLIREAHVRYLQKGLKGLGGSYVCLDASRPWLIYWILHALDVLDALPLESTFFAVETLKTCFFNTSSTTGGFGGGPMQLSHCAPSYAAVLSLCLIGGETAYRAIDRPALYKFFHSVKHSSGGFRMHDDGEVDVRGTYTVICIAALLNMLTPELAKGAAEYALSCQTYEGGFGGEPGVEAHGGYVFCALAALVILDKTDDLRLDDLEKWLCQRQLAMEGGFQGRTNKLVDSCYSYWQGASCALVDHVRNKRDKPSSSTEKKREHLRWRSTTSIALSEEETDEEEEAVDETPSFDNMALQRYILLCSQDYPGGGLRDKPGKPRDYYHSCYSLSGLAIAQHMTRTPRVYGDAGNLVEAVHPAFNIRVEKADRALDYFATFPSTHAELTEAA